jgi:hypothetical protein
VHVGKSGLGSEKYYGKKSFEVTYGSLIRADPGPEHNVKNFEFNTIITSDKRDTVGNGYFLFPFKAVL